MPAKIIPCALCQDEAAAVFCVNDDAHLCVSCDTTVHANNPLLARHERRPLNALTLQAESAAHNGSSAPSTVTDGDVAVVPQLGGGGADAQPAVLSPLDPSPAPAPLTLYEDSFFSRALSASDLLDLDSDELELPGGANPFAFDPMHDAVVPSFGEQLRPIGAPRWGQTPALPQQTSFLSQQRYAPYVPQQHMVPMGAAKPMPRVRTPEEEAEDAARVARHRERQRKKRNFGRTVRYQSRRAYAEIRPRIKGRFVTPEEYAAYQAQQAAQKAGGDKTVPAPASYAEPAAPPEEDAVVPVPSFA